MGVLESLLQIPWWLGGNALVQFSLPRSSQRHKCSKCSKTKEIKLQNLIDNFANVLTDAAFSRVFSSGASAAASAVSNSSSSGSAASSPSSSSSSSSSAAATPASATARAYFNCECGGRLGPHTFPGDATNGNKEELTRLVSLVYKKMGHEIFPNIKDANREAMLNLGGSDIFWVD